MKDEDLKGMTKDDANKLLISDIDKKRWVELHNTHAKCYCMQNGVIHDIPAAGWWY